MTGHQGMDLYDLRHFRVGDVKRGFHLRAIPIPQTPVERNPQDLIEGKFADIGSRRIGVSVKWIFYLILRRFQRGNVFFDPFFS
jgi:hypothetical protein